MAPMLCIMLVFLVFLMFCLRRVKKNMFLESFFVVKVLDALCWVFTHIGDIGSELVV